MVLLHVKNKRVEYKFEINAKYTVIAGNSGVGKTTLYELVSDLYTGVQGVQNLSGVEIIPVPTNPRGFSLDFTEGAVYVLDEDNLLLHQADSARLFQRSKNYFIIITRDVKAISYLPVTLDNVKEMKTSGAYHTLEQKYRLSDYRLRNEGIKAVIVEDEKSGCSFIKEWVDELITYLNRGEDSLLRDKVIQDNATSETSTEDLYTKGTKVLGMSTPEA